MLNGLFILTLMIGQSTIAPSSAQIMEPVPVLRDATPLPTLGGSRPTDARPPAIRPNSTPPARPASPETRALVTTRSETERAIGALIRAERIRSLLNALHAFDAGRYQQAEAAADRLLKSDPWDTMALTIAGAARLRLNDPAGAIARFESYVKYHPLEAMGHFYLGLARHIAGDRERAIEAYWTALLLDPGLQAARVNMNLLTAP